MIREVLVGHDLVLFLREVSTLLLPKGKPDARAACENQKTQNPRDERGFVIQRSNGELKFRMRLHDHFLGNRG